MSPPSGKGPVSGNGNEDIRWICPYMMRGGVLMRALRSVSFAVDSGIGSFRVRRTFC